MSEEDLKPATYEEPEQRAFKPPSPWKWIVAVTVALAGIIGYYQWRERSKEQALRDEIVQTYGAEVEPVAQRVRAFRDKLETWVTQVAHDVPDSWADERLDLSGLHGASGVYLRIHEDSVDDPGTLADAGRSMGPDAIARCLGLSPLSLRGLYERATFVESQWLERVNAADDNLRLRVIKDELDRRTSRDLPVLMDMVQSDYFLLAVQHGSDRREHPVDVYLWDLRRDALLLKTRTQARGALIPVRVGIGDTPYGTAPPPQLRAGVTDCSIASQVREVAGSRSPEIESDMPVAPPPEEASEEGDTETLAPDTETPTADTETPTTDSEAPSAE
ncbi:MAG: hypothetical protein JJ863_14530 [Deltaproteobacteria bacterium]|nr:hypothetical protein [Deltaproteobacteria bacterium]